MPTLGLMAIGIAAAVIVGLLLGLLDWPTPSDSTLSRWFRGRRLKITRGQSSRAAKWLHSELPRLDGMYSAEAWRIAYLATGVSEEAVQASWVSNREARQ
jgi:hypothetical protein